MNLFKKFTIYLLCAIAGVCASILFLIYFYQEILIFHPTKLPANYTYQLNSSFEEKWIETSDGFKLNALLFKADSSKGIVIYLHGNSGAMTTYAGIAPYFTNLGYDFLMFDYRGYGKSTGKIESEKQLFDDDQLVYNSIKKNYNENNIIIVGYSIGTGPAAQLASKNKPKFLILLAPYFNLIEMGKKKYGFVPEFIYRYKLMTNEYIKDIKAPIAIFHGTSDITIDYHSSVKLYELCKPGDKLYLLSNQSHGGITDNSDFRMNFERFIE